MTLSHLSNPITRSPVLALLMLLMLPAYAQAQPTGVGLPLWEVGALGGSLTAPAYPASAQRFSRNLVLPYLIYRGDFFPVDRDGIDARLRLAPDYELDVGLSGSFPASANDISARQGMPDLGTLVEFGPRLKIRLGQPAPGLRLGLELPLRNVIEFNGGARSQGMVFEPTLVLEGADIGAGWSLSAKAGASWGDQQINQYFYGVPAAYATEMRHTYEAQAGLIGARASLGTSKNLSADVRVFGYARMDYYGLGANTASPLFMQTSSPSLGLGLIWTLGRSETLVNP